MPNQMLITEVNGWTIQKRCIGSTAEYYIARKNGRVHTSKSLNYLIRLCRERN